MCELPWTRSDMTATHASLFDNVPKSDPLNLWSPAGLDYRGVSELLEYDKNELSKLAGVAKSSVRFDAKIPRELKERLEQIAVIASLVAEYFEGNVERTALWFRMPNPMLGGLAPRDMIRRGRYNKLLNFVLEARGENTKR